MSKYTAVDAADYAVVTADSIPELEDKVKEYLALGWQLYGNLSVIRCPLQPTLKERTDAFYVYHQVLISVRL